MKIEVETCSGGDIGTGFLVGPRLVATVDHVVGGAQSVALVRNGKTVAHGVVIGADPARDIALIRADRPVSGYRFHLTARAPQLGESVSALGFPLDLPLTLTHGLISGSDRTIPIEGIERRQLVQTDASVNPGNSGGPLFTNGGTVVGLVDARVNGESGLGFAVSAAVAAPLIQAWTAAPQPIPAATCAPKSSQTQTAPATASPPYAGHDFTITYPAGWQVSHIAEPGGNIDNTFAPSAGGGLLIRVDENPNPPTTSLRASAAPVIAQLRREPGYLEIGLDNSTIDGVRALRWEFEVDENGQLLHKVDEFFVDTNGHGWGLLYQSPEERWSQDAAALQSYANSFQFG